MRKLMNVIADGAMKLADKIEPTEQEYRDAGLEVPERRSKFARLLVRMFPMMNAHGGQKHWPPKPTDSVVTMNGGTKLRVWTDGSFRREPTRLRGKGYIKMFKRHKHLEMNRARTGFSAVRA